MILLPAFLFSQGEIIYSKLSDTVEASNVSKGYIDSAFSYCSSEDEIIDYDDCNICKSRAHILARAINKNFPLAVTSKVWLFADCKRSSMAAYYKYKPNVYLELAGKCSKWSYHVAPVIITPADTFVIDPATQNSAVSLRDWTDKIIPKNGTALMVIKHRGFFIYPEDSNDLFDDNKINWLDSDNNTTDNSFSRSIDEMTRARLGLIEPWRMKHHTEMLRKMVE